MKKDERFIFLLGQAKNRLFAKLDKSLVEAAGVTAAQSGALYYLMANNGSLLTELSRAMMLDKSATTGLVNLLESKNLVKRKPVPSDHRDLKVLITEQGKIAAMNCLSITKQYNDAIKEGLSQEEIDAFSSVLQKIIQQFSE